MPAGLRYEVIGSGLGWVRPETAARRLAATWGSCTRWPRRRGSRCGVPVHLRLLSGCLEPPADVAPGATCRPRV